MALVERRYPSGKVNYQVRVQDHFGKWFPSKTFKRKTDAERYERQLLAGLDVGESASPKALRELTFGNYWLQWQEIHRHNTSDGWKLSQDQMGRDYLIPVIGDLKLQKLSSTHVSKVLSHARELGRSNSTLRLVYNLMHRVFECIVADGFLAKNPLSKAMKPEAQSSETAFLTPEESWKLLLVAKDDFLGPAIWLGILAGLRTEAIQALEWQSIDLNLAQILICQAYKRKIGRIDPFPKGKRWEYVPIAKPLLDYLAPLAKTESSRCFVASGKQGGMLDHHVFNDGLKRLCLKAGVRRITPHGLRHSCTELFQRQGANTEDLRRLLNHGDVTTTLRYIHKAPERLRSIAAGIQMPDLLVSSPQNASFPVFSP